MTLPELIRRGADGDEEVQTALLDELEPLLFGYFRSLLPADDGLFDEAVALTHAATLGFLLDLRAGRVRIPDAAALRAACHRIVVAVLRVEDRVRLTAEGDDETGGLTPGAVALAQEWEVALSDTLLAAAARRLQGAPSEDWMDAARILEQRGLVRARDPKRNG